MCSLLLMLLDVVLMFLMWHWSSTMTCPTTLKPTHTGDNLFQLATDYVHQFRASLLLSVTARTVHATCPSGASSNLASVVVGASCCWCPHIDSAYNMV